MNEKKLYLVIMIIIMSFVCMTGCEKPDKNSGELEAMGKIYLLDNFYYERGIDAPFPVHYESMLTFLSSDYKINVRIILYDNRGWDWKIPIGTFKMEGDKEPVIGEIILSCGDNLLYGSWREDSSATLTIKKSGDNYNITLKGILAVSGEERMEKIKLTYTL